MPIFLPRGGRMAGAAEPPLAVLFVKASVARESFRSQTLAVFVERLLRGLMITHGLLGVDATLRLPGFALFGGQNPGWTC